MFRMFYLVVTLAALSLFGYAQYQGWNLFDDVANPHSSSGNGGSRIYHK